MAAGVTGAAVIIDGLLPGPGGEGKVAAAGVREGLEHADDVVRDPCYGPALKADDLRRVSTGPVRDRRVLEEEVSDALANALAAALRNGATLDEMIGILRTHCDGGVAQPEAARVLDALRAKASTEAEEDRILELMDFVHGFCALISAYAPAPR